MTLKQIGGKQNKVQWNLLTRQKQAETFSVRIDRVLDYRVQNKPIENGQMGMEINVG